MSDENLQKINNECFWDYNFNNDEIIELTYHQKIYKD